MYYKCRKSEKAVPLKYLTNFPRTFEIPLINCKISLILTWSRNCVISEMNRVTNLTDTKLYVLVITLSNNDNEKLLPHVKSGFTIIWNKYQLTATTQVKNKYLDYLIDFSFQVVNSFSDLLLFFQK